MIPVSIKAIQSILKIPETGIYDELTEAAVRNFQLKNSLIPTGIVDNDTSKLLFPTEEIPMPEIDSTTPTTDLSEVNTTQKINQYRLARGQFLNGPTSKEYVFLHHTAGWENPYATVDQWATDQRGQVATQFVIGGRNCQTLSDKYDGDIVQCFDYENYGWHLGIGNVPLHYKSIGIELCNFGWVIKSGSEYKSYINKRVAKSEVIDLKQEWRGKRYFHRYTDDQLNSLKFLLNHIASEIALDIRSGLQQRIKTTNKFTAFDFDEKLLGGATRGVFVHANVSGKNKYGQYEKWDCFPQDELIDLILSL